MIVNLVMTVSLFLYFSKGEKLNWRGVVTLLILSSLWFILLPTYLLFHYFFTDTPKTPIS